MRARGRRIALLLLVLAAGIPALAPVPRPALAAELDEDEVARALNTFRERDERLLLEQHAIHHDEERLIQSAKDTASELESLMRSDSRE